MQGVKLLRGKLEVSVRQRSAEKVRDLLADWYKARAKEVFARRLNAMLDQAIWVTGRPALRILTMQTQWGSCSPHGRITLNPHLVKASRDCIDYVILHELCHIAEHNHSEQFYRLMSQVGKDQRAIGWDGGSIVGVSYLIVSHSHSPAGYPCRAVSLVLMPPTDPQRIPLMAEKAIFSVQNNR